MQPVHVKTMPPLALLAALPPPELLLPAPLPLLVWPPLLPRPPLLVTRPLLLKLTPEDELEELEPELPPASFDPPPKTDPPPDPPLLLPHE